MHDLATGSGDRAAAALLTTRRPIGLASWGLDLGVICREEAPFTDARQVTAEAEKAFPDFPDAVLARTPYLFTPLQNCAVWDVPAAAESVSEPVDSDVPVLLFAGGLDPITPARWAEAAAASLSSSQLVAAPSAGHDVLVWEPECATPLMLDFLNSPRAGVDATCLAAASVRPFTTD